MLHVLGQLVGVDGVELDKRKKTLGVFHPAGPIKVDPVGYAHEQFQLFGPERWVRD